MKIALSLQYDGSRYHGWQIQQSSPTVEGELRRALAAIDAQPKNLSCCGRTDSGVHCCSQVVSFSNAPARPERAWLLGLNRHLPADIAVNWVQQVRPDFNARASALARRYLYLINNANAPAALWRAKVYDYYWPLDLAAMRTAGQSLVGEHDFEALRARSCQALSSWRRVYWLELGKVANWVWIDICANAFLHHMVRNIVGCLLLVGRGQRPQAWLQQLLEGRDRRAAAATAPAKGLYLLEAFYGREYGLPRAPMQLSSSFDSLPIATSVEALPLQQAAVAQRQNFMG